ncbi:histidine phosphatase family protein [Geodermatophilus amargosae]|uniref:histidine phosphatase family protein n=1 Tax=Geodermatophilus amargosae TaxID=1296565 RepID=UPI0034E021D1
MTAPAALDLPVPRLLVWRHGRTEWNATGRFQGQMDPPLDAEGRAQAARTAPHLVATGLGPATTVVVASDLVRAADTATALTDALGVPLRLDGRLREHGLGCWEGLTRDEVAERHPEQYADWLAGRPVHGRGGEQSADVARRALAALQDLPPAEVAVVVTHGGTAGRLIEALLELGPQHRRVFGPLANCGWSELARHGERWRLMRHNTVVAALPGSLEGPVPGRPATAPVDAAATPEGAAPPPSQDADAVL